eukprot:6455582-Amphidinium_carterae.1
MRRRLQCLSCSNLTGSLQWHMTKGSGSTSFILHRHSSCSDAHLQHLDPLLLLQPFHLTVPHVTIFSSTYCKCCLNALMWKSYAGNAKQLSVPGTCHPQQVVSFLQSARSGTSAAHSCNCLSCTPSGAAL